MPTVFTKIMRGELPGQVVWNDEHCAAFLSINPLSEGHTLVVPKTEVDHWLDLEQALGEHLYEVSRQIGKAIHRAFRPSRVALMIAGFEVPHVHLHVVGVNSIEDMSWERARADIPPGELGKNADLLRSALEAENTGHTGHTGNNTGNNA